MTDADNDPVEAAEQALATATANVERIEDELCLVEDPAALERALANGDPADVAGVRSRRVALVDELFSANILVVHARRELLLAQEAAARAEIVPLGDAALRARQAADDARETADRAALLFAGARAEADGFRQDAADARRLKEDALRGRYAFPRRSRP